MSDTKNKRAYAILHGMDVVEVWQFVEGEEPVRKSNHKDAARLVERGTLDLNEGWSSGECCEKQKPWRGLA